MNILTVIRSEHDVIRSITGLLLETRGTAGTREQLWFRLKSELLAHAWAEEAALYARLASRPATSPIARHSIEEHQTIDELVAQLDHIGFDHPTWLPTLRRLAEISEHHLAEEERELFPVAGRELTEAEKEEATTTYRERRQAWLTRNLHTLQRTTRSGVDGRTYEARSIADLRALARERGIDDPTRLDRSELVSQLRDAPEADV
ncbi:MAG: hemerythrin domain-containing protein [Alphaproteobacteria bacterium]|nr:hemerythrin domain-containing protein [Alphaproteobacteria bacterium]